MGRGNNNPPPQSFQGGANFFHYYKANFTLFISCGFMKSQGRIFSLNRTHPPYSVKKKADCIFLDSLPHYTFLSSKYFRFKDLEQGKGTVSVPVTRNTLEHSVTSVPLDTTVPTRMKTLKSVLLVIRLENNILRTQGVSNKSLKCS